MGALSLDTATDQLHMAIRDFTAAYDSALARDPMSRHLAVCTALSAMRYVETHGLTPTGRRELRKGIAALRLALGLPDEEDAA